MEKDIQLFELLSKLIAVQIKKYVALATVGVGPDALLNASLVYDEVSELLKLASSLLKTIKNKKSNPSLFLSVFSQVKFYLEQESFRAHAGWLLDSNNIHDTVDERTRTLLKEMESLAKLAEISDFSCPEKPHTDIQKQCELDSFEIAYRILTLACNVRKNPEMELDKKIPPHAQKILKKNATTRYIEFKNEIDEEYEKCEQYLKNATLPKRTTSLTKKDALSYQKTHEAQLSSLLNEYQNIQPDSFLFSSAHQPYTVATPTPKASYSKLSFFTCAAVGVSVLIYLVPYLKSFYQENEGENLTI